MIALKVVNCLISAHVVYIPIVREVSNSQLHVLSLRDEDF